MPTLHKGELLGNKPYLFRQKPSRRLSNTVWVQYYTLIAPDSFEQGSAYSLHLTEEKALNFKPPFYAYRKAGEPKIAYVSHTTLEKVLNNRSKRGIFKIDK